MITKKLIKLADYLDSIGAIDEANRLDSLIIKSAELSDDKKAQIRDDARREALGYFIQSVTSLKGEFHRGGAGTIMNKLQELNKAQAAKGVLKVDSNGSVLPDKEVPGNSKNAYHAVPLPRKLLKGTAYEDFDVYILKGSSGKGKLRGLIRDLKNRLVEIKADDFVTVSKGKGEMKEQAESGFDAETELALTSGDTKDGDTLKIVTKDDGSVEGNVETKEIKLTKSQSKLYNYLGKVDPDFQEESFMLLRKNGIRGWGDWVAFYKYCEARDGEWNIDELAEKVATHAADWKASISGDLIETTQDKTSYDMNVKSFPNNDCRLAHVFTYSTKVKFQAKFEEGGGVIGTAKGPEFPITYSCMLAPKQGDGGYIYIKVKDPKTGVDKDIAEWDAFSGKVTYVEEQFPAGYLESTMQGRKVVPSYPNKLVRFSLSGKGHLKSIIKKAYDVLTNKKGYDAIKGSADERICSDYDDMAKYLKTFAS